MNEKRISKFLSLILRHKPEVLGIDLDKNGWADVEILLNKMNEREFKIDLVLLKSIVANNDKKRFVFDSDFSKIRASQGHSIPVDLNLAALKPPETLFHGTAIQNIRSIKVKGLRKGNRHHVHLSEDKETAKKVGMRHGKPAILIIDAQKMSQDGLHFYRTENNVWLTAHVAPKYIDFPN